MSIFFIYNKHKLKENQNEKVICGDRMYYPFTILLWTKFK